MKEFKLGRSILSGYYVAVLISFFLFQLLKEPIVSTWTTWFVSALKEVFKIDATSRGPAWLSLVFICFLIVFIIRRFVVEILDLHSSKDNSPAWENVVLGFLILGFFFYTINKVFDQPMPKEWFTDPFIKFLGGQSTDMNNLPITEKNTWTIVPWLWTVGPLVFMYIRTIASTFKNGDKS